MREFKGKTAFVTGGACGIGFALAGAFADAGMRVMVADIQEKALDQALTELKGRGAGAEVRGVLCDVADIASLKRAADETFAAFGNVHLVCNNAGVGWGGRVESITAADWEWQIGVNLMGVIYGVQAFLPHIKAHGEGGHIVNTASMSGLLAIPGLAPHTVTKFAVVGLSETLAAELAGTSVGISVLCPAFVRTPYAENIQRLRALHFGTPVDETPEPATAQLATLIHGGIDPKDVARRVIRAIRDNELYIFTHPEMRAPLEDRFRQVIAAFDKAAAV
jgi:NAD(P)-dependent dehydrogenase (short-subunit alcohol dehydrogenase family)